LPIIKGQSIVGRGDDAPLLAGATLALLEHPALYEQTQALLSDALDHSYSTDPIWGALKPAHAFAPHVLQRPPGKPKMAAADAKKLARKSAPRGTGKRKQAVILESIITCPNCGPSKIETMPTNACQYFYECTGCATKLRPKSGDCCVFCSYGSVPCPPMQAEGTTGCCAK
jgi:hypothetical protein